MLKGFFVTGTDTDVGKTLFCSLVMSTYKDHEDIKYFKPVQTGEDSDTKSVIDCAQLSEKNIIPPLYSFKAPMSPHRAAALENQTIDIERICKKLNEYQDQILLVEGAGGLEVPLYKDVHISTLAKKLNLPIIIVSSTRLGTINHTLMTYQRAKQLGLQVKGVVLTGKKDPGLREVLEEQGVPVLFEIPYIENKDEDWLAQVDELQPLVKSLFREEKNKENWQGKDQQFVWHPFTQHKYLKNLPLVTRASGCKLFLEDGRELIDAISSWWVNLHGHSHPKISQAIAEQAAKLEHVIFAGFTHEPAVQISENILSLFKGSMDKVFFSDNGSTAVEVALKMAYQYQKQTGQSQRQRFLALKGGYHGDTLGAMSVGPGGGMHEVFKPLMMGVDFISPDNFEELNQIENIADKYVACIVEPMVQGAGGMKMYSADYLKALRDLCKRQGILFICDEIFTGFYRTGNCFAFEHAGILPDLVCLSKGITGGFLPLSVTVTTNKIFEAFIDDNLAKAFLHGHSYTANPIACVAANASFELLMSDLCQRQIKEIERGTRALLKNFENDKNISNIRQLGTIGAFDIKSREGYFQGNFAQEFSQKCQAQGVLIRPLGGTIYTVPPYCITAEQLNRVYAVIEETLAQTN